MANENDVYRLTAEAQINELKDVIEALKDIASAQRDVGSSADNASGGTERASGSLFNMAKQAAAAALVMGGLFLSLDAFTSAVGATVEFDKSLRNIQAVTKQTDAEMAGLSEELLRIGASTFLEGGPQAVANAFYDIAGGVADAESRIAILEAAVETAEAGNADLSATTSALISVMNSYSLGAEDAAFASDVLTQIVNKGVGTMDEFGAALPQVTGLASSLSVELDDLGAMMAYLTTKGYSASESATQLKAMMTALINPNADMTRALEEAGFATGQQAIEAYGLAGAYAFLNANSETFQDNMAGVVGSTEALNGVLALTGEEALATLEDFSTGLDEATESSHKEQMKSLSAQFALLKNRVSAAALTIGTTLVPYALAALETIGDLSVELMDNLNPALDAVQNAFDDVIRALGGTDAIQEFANSIIDFVSHLSPETLVVFGTVLAAIVLPTLLAIAGAAVAAAAPFVLLGLAVAGVAYAIENNFLGIKDLIGDALDVIGGLLSSATNVIEGIKNAFETGGFDAAADFILDGIASGITDVAGWVSTNILTPIAAALSSAETWTVLAGSLNNIMKGISTGIMDAVSWVSANILTPIASAIANPDNQAAFLNTLSSILGAISAGVTDMAGWVRKAILIPLVNAITNEENLAQFATTLQAFISAIGNGVADFTTFINTKILTPIAEYLTNPDNLSMFGSFIMNMLSIIPDATEYIGTWVLSHILTPLAAGLTNPENLELAFGVLTGFGTSILDFIATTFPDMAAWAKTNVIDPLMRALATGINTFFTGVNSAIPDTIDFRFGRLTVPMPRPLPDIDWDFGTLTLDVPDNPFPNVTIPGYASGGSFTVPGTGTSDQPFLVGLTPGEQVNIVPRVGSGIRENLMANITILLDGRTIFEGQQEIAANRS